jgi:large subunit ribosomal protein L25
MLHLRDTVLVRAKPDDLPSGIELDITPLVDFEATLHASDLVMPAGVTLITDPTEALARVQQPRVEEEPVAAAPEAGAEEGAAEGAAQPETGAAETSAENAQS